VRRAAVVVLALAALAGCGSGDDAVPADAVAVVDGREISRDDYDALLARTRKNYENQKRDFPKAGTPEFQVLKSQFVQYLVQRAQMRQAAEDLDIEVTDEQVSERLKQVKEQYLGGDEARYERQLRESGLTDAQVREDIRDQIVSEKLFQNVTRDTKVTAAEVEAQYAKNKAQYSQPESREVRHILVKSKARAEALYAELQAGGDFATLAKENSLDAGSKDHGGQLTISRGQTVAPFDEKAFELKVNEISTPVKTEFGFHVIQALGPVEPAKVTPLKDVEAAIKQQLLESQKNEEMTAWVDDLKQDYADKVVYQTGFAPPATATTPAATATTTG
jgi:parvulin-like peptidyl-prolyl isomerase